jgi:hypothetical protein
VAKSGIPDLGFGWELTPATTLAVVVPRQVGWKVGVGEFAWSDIIGDALRASATL